jgi:hypothetical protein
LKPFFNEAVRDSITDLGFGRLTTPVGTPIMIADEWPSLLSVGSRLMSGASGEAIWPISHFVSVKQSL